MTVAIFKPIKASCAERRLTIQTQGGPAGERWLYYARPDAAAPRYDLAAVLARTPDEEPVRAKLGPQQGNPIYERSDEGRPWTERHPWIVYGALGLGVAGLAWFAIRLILETQNT